MKYTYDYPRPMVAADVIVMSKHSGNDLLLLIKRLNEPFKNCWALPGGFVDENESLVDAAKRELKEETGLIVKEITQFEAFGDPGRDPRGHSVSVVFITKVDNESLIKAGDDAKEVRWFSVNNLPKLAFDHEKIIKMALIETKKTAK